MAIPICKLVNVFLSIRFLICRHLCEVVEILDHRGLQRICSLKKKKESVNLSEKQSVRDGLAHHEGGDKVLNSTRLSTVGSEVERVETSEQAEEMKYSFYRTNVIITSLHAAGSIWRCWHRCSRCNRHTEGSRATTTRQAWARLNIQEED